jgi:ribosomal protein S13
MAKIRQSLKSKPYQWAFTITNVAEKIYKHVMDITDFKANELTDSEIKKLDDAIKYLIEVRNQLY